MAYSKNFPRTIKGSNYPTWEEVFLNKEEEKAVEEEVKTENIILMKDCIKDAHLLLREKNLDFSHTDVIKAAIALFEKRASHVVYAKERKAKEKFDEKFNKD
jgi:hypothetical protein